MVNDRKLMSPKMAAEYLGPEGEPLKETTLTWWRCVGRGPRYVKMGHRVFYRRADLDAFVLAGVTDPEAVAS